MNSSAAVLALMFLGMLTRRNPATRFLSRIGVTRRAILSVINIGTLRGVTRTIVGAVLIGCHSVPRKLSPC